MIDVSIKDKNYSLLVHYHKQDSYRKSFDALTQNVFDLSFETWYQAGFWKENYIPYTLFDDSKAVSNISISIMNFTIFGKNQRYIQLGAVETDKQYRHQGLNRFLMEYILQEWDTQCDFIYLFANPSVLEFYPKFGFKQVREYAYYKSLISQSSDSNFVQVDMSSAYWREKIYHYIQNSISFSQFSMQKNADLVMFYCIIAMKDHVFYSKTLDAFVIMTTAERQLHLFDIFSIQKTDLEAIIQSLRGFGKNEILLGFTPLDTQGFQVKEKQDEDVLFIQNNKSGLFENHKMMFPLLSHG